MMTKILIRKNLRDLRSDFSEFFSIFALSLLSLLVFSGLMSVSNGMKYEFNDWAQKSSLADEWISVRNSDGATNLLKQSSVKQLQKQYVFNTYIGTNAEKKMIQTVVVNNNSVSKPYVVSGSDFSATKKGVWIDSNFASKNNYKVGHKIKLSLSGSEREYKVKGLIESPNFIGYTGPTNDIIANHSKYGYILTNSQTMPAFKNKTNQILVTGKNGFSTSALKKSIESSLGSSVISISNRSEYGNVSKYVDKSNSLEKLSIMFCLILFSLVVLITETTMSRLVNNQRSIIGLFRALGLSKLSIVAHYGMYGLVTTLCGGIIGLLLGPMTIARLILNKQKPLYNMPFWKIRTSNLGWDVLIFLTLVGVMTAVFSVAKILNNTPASILQPRAVKGTPKNLFEIFPNFWARLKWDSKWVMRDKSRTKSKELIGIIGVVGSLVLLITSFGIQQSLNQTNSNTFGEVFQYSNEIKVNTDASPAKLNKVMSRLDGDHQRIEQISTNIRTSRAQMLTTGTIVSPGLYVKLPLVTGGLATLNSKNGVYVSNLIANKLGIQKGSNVEVNSTVMSKKEILPVLGVVKVSTPQGIYLSSKTWKNIGEAFTVTSIFTSQNINGKMKNSAAINQVNTLSGNRQDANKVLGSFQSVIVLLIIFSLFLGWFILYNLGMLNFSERYREYATMRVLGFRLNEVRSVIVKDNLFTWLMGTIIGVPVGMLFLQVYVGIADTNTNEFFVHISLVRIVIAVAIILINVLITSLVVARQVKRIEMASALKSVD